MNFTFLPGSIVGFVGYPEALFVRSLASGLTEAGHQVRVVEQRRNQYIEETLRSEGSEAYRQIHTEFQSIQFHTYEPRTGPRLLEWVSREMALSDVIVAVNGIPQELCRWIANLEQPGSIRMFMTYRPDELTDGFIRDYEIDKFEAVLTTGLPASNIETILIHPSIEPSDISFVPAARQSVEQDYTYVSSATETALFLDVVQRIFIETAFQEERSEDETIPLPQAIHQNGAEPIDDE